MYKPHVVRLWLVDIVHIPYLSTKHTQMQPRVTMPLSQNCTTCDKQLSIHHKTSTTIKYYALDSGRSTSRCQLAKTLREIYMCPMFINKWNVDRNKVYVTVYTWLQIWWMVNRWMVEYGYNTEHCQAVSKCTTCIMMQTCQRSDGEYQCYSWETLTGASHPPHHHSNHHRYY